MSILSNVGVSCWLVVVLSSVCERNPPETKLVINRRMILSTVQGRGRIEPINCRGYNKQVCFCYSTHTQMGVEKSITILCHMLKFDTLALKTMEEHLSSRV